MSKAPTFKLNFKGVGEVLKSPEVAALTNDVARRLAASIGDDAEVKAYTTDRKAASVSVPTERQSRDGLLTKAAADMGLIVREK